VFFRQFAQFDYSQQGYGQGGDVYGQQYTGSIMTPAAPFTAPPGQQGGENYEDEPPLMEGEQQKYFLTSHY
jgi:hypothetical protein